MIDENLKKAIRDNKLVLFIGAGASISLNHPSWKSLVSGILDDLNSDFSETSDLNFNNLKSYLSNGTRSPLDILNKLENDSNNGNEYKVKAKVYTHKIFNEFNTNNSLNSNIHKLLWKLSTKIITTNYDHILEHNKPEDRDIDIFGNENSFMTLKAQKDDSKFLYKIHGDFKNPETIILFDSDYKLIYSDNNANQDALGDFFKNKTFLFLGFSLSDPFVNELFSKIKRLYNNYPIGNHFIFSTSVSNDFSQFDVKQIKIDDWKDSLETYLNELIKIKSEIIENKKENYLEDSILEEDSSNLLLTIKNKTTELKKAPGNKILASELHDLKSKVYQLLYKDLDDLIKIDGYKNTHIEVLFESIYGNENLANETIIEINRIRNDIKEYQWYERSQLVSAIACSLIIFDKADSTKISLLIDFINDSEEKVWQKALTYLVIVLNHLGYKWVKYPVIRTKVKSLTLNSKVQEGCQKILEYLLIFGIEIFTFSEKVFDKEYFQKPSNYFLPFFKDENPLFDSIYENYAGENIDEFINLLEKAPFPDCLKYIYCNTKINRSKEKKELDETEKDFVLNHSIVNGSFYPYAGIMQEFVSFIREFPAIQHKKLLDTQIKLTTTPLKDYILNEKEKYRALGIHFFKDKQWGQAIINFNNYLDFEPEDLMILSNLEICYLNNKETENADNVAFRIRDIYPENIDNLINLIKIYIGREDYEEAIKISDECLRIDLKNPNVYYLRAWILYYKEEYQNALEELENCSKFNYENKVELNDMYCTIYRRLENNNLALEYINKAIKLHEASKESKDSELYHTRSQVYENLDIYNEAINNIDIALSIKKDPLYMIDKVYILLKMNNLTEAKILLDKMNSSQKNNSEYYNAKANYYRLEGNFDLALNMIEKAIKLSNSDTSIPVNHYIGTKAAIYGTMGDDEKFYELLDNILLLGQNVKRFFPDIKNKYKKDKSFLEILEKYNQSL
ncbi:Predicted O-linked N-acetylglucosamine transferase, SPINDLY family [Chryseobacterium nakagawai]|uniref:Tetratricopeptide repeat protein n=1 Tax=Chryseobacterium nakagawai TaxID=1241982 RepID=A0AAD0YLD5_CHRNA|nr:SIR2 family protein [Chryseobacterium nakagawai]AZA91019.1 hypothetical protein EG343_10425 [Chryseobacterium nakagawai]VEH22570.1 Predicted O-linked N-acetylglucosamine transferase, SPINDLY family [Chryseobacterium nakagawai]